MASDGVVLSQQQQRLMSLIEEWPPTILVSQPNAVARVMNGDDAYSARIAEKKRKKGYSRLPTVAILGHSGAGKDLFSRLLHTAVHPAEPYNVVGTSAIILGVIEAVSPELATLLSGTRQLSVSRRYIAAVGDELCRNDMSVIVRNALAYSDFAVGIRRHREFQASLASVIDFSVWIHRPGNAVDPTLSITEENFVTWLSSEPSRFHWINNDGDKDLLTSKAVETGLALKSFF